MNTEQERAAFEAACHRHAEEAGHEGAAKLERNGDGYADPHTQAAWWGWREGRAALQSQDREDSERLDWLEDQAQTSRTGVSIDYVYDAQDGYVNEKGYRFMRHRFTGPLGKTAREAIDHARRVEEDGE